MGATPTHRATSAFAIVFLLVAGFSPGTSYPNKVLDQDKFRQLSDMLPTPNAQRTASGAPGQGYWQQRADYVIDAEFDGVAHKLAGREQITYHNKLREEDIDPALLRTERYFYAVDVKNIGGLVMPLLFHITFADGGTEDANVPAEIWRLDAGKITKLFLTEQQITSIELDREGKTADADMGNNAWPRRVEERRFQLFKTPKQSRSPAPMTRTTGAICKRVVATTTNLSL